jgi:protein arginine N-methyltransferase 1
MERPPRVDVVVSETLGNYPLEEDIIATMRDARKRHLKPGGIIIPNRISQFVAPVVTDRVHNELTTWDAVGYGIDFGPARTMSLNNIYVRILAPGDLLDEGRTAVEWDSFDLSASPSSTRKGEASFEVRAPTTIYGLATWWSADLVAGVALSTAPDAPRTHWEQLYLPQLRPITANAGDRVTIALRSRTTREGGTTLAWSVTHANAGGSPISRQAMDLEKGYLP